MNSSEIRARLCGPIPSLTTPFHKDGTVDYSSLRKLIDFCIAAGSKVLMLTVGDSHYICLSDEEIAQITRVTCEHASGRALVIAADRYHSTARSVEFAKYARSVGAQVVICLPPDWAQSCTEQTLADHYAEVGKSMPVMIVTGVFVPRGADFGLKTIDLALQQSSVVAVKDDFCGNFAHRLSHLAYGRLALISGGLKENHLNQWPYGCDGYLASFITFKPEITHRYWSAIQSSDIPAARQVIRDVEMPWFEFIQKLPGGFDAGIHGTQEIFGIAGRWRRKPYYSLNDAEMERLKDFYRGLRLL